MSEVYYRKWRPQSLAQVVGQEAVTQTLRQAVSLGRVAHAYLFCGPRGTGKTSTARILAKAVNCLAPRDGEPDNECDRCLAVNEGRALDLIEIDAASNRGIDDIRSLSEKIHFVPSEARHKVYIIDEVHMLTEPAFNALLKTLEEPPAHAILVLATTEVHKVPLTIISRCQRFDFRRISLERIVDRLAGLCRDEDVEASADALTLIARSSSGSLRDAENLLEQVVVSYGSPMTETHVRDMLGLSGEEVSLELVAHLINKAVPDGLTLINDVAARGEDLRQLHRGTVELLRGVLLMNTNAGTLMGYPDDTAARLKGLADSTSLEHLLHVLKTFAGVDLRRDSSSPLPLELALAESCIGPPEVAPVQQRPAPRAEPRSQPRPVAARTPAPVQPAPARPASVERASLRPSPRAPDPQVLSSEPGARLESQWDGIVRSLRHTGKRFKVGALLKGCSRRHVADNRVTLEFPYVSHVERFQQELDDPETRGALAKVLADAMDGPYEVEVVLAAPDNDGGGQAAAQKSHLVRAAQAMGARVVGERRSRQNEQEDGPAGPAASEADAPAPGGA